MKSEKKKKTPAGAPVVPRDPKMTHAQKQEVLAKIDSEGSFEYVFVQWGSFEEIDDPEFHRRREAFVAAYRSLEEYLGEFDEDFDPDAEEPPHGCGR